jgi:hypothetical protein
MGRYLARVQLRQLPVLLSGQRQYSKSARPDAVVADKKEKK